jgi:hypothetical protein
MRLSRQVCKQQRVKLPDRNSCGPRCDEYPDCLPPIPADVLTGLVRLRGELKSRHEAATAVNDLLEGLHEAIVDGLTRKSDGGESS